MIRFLIGKIRRQPKAVRNNIALGIAGSFTAVVFAVWAYQLPARLSEVTKVAGEADGPGAFSQIFDQLGEQVAAVKEAMPGKTEEPVDANPLDSLVTEYRASTTSSTTVSAASASSSSATTSTSTQPRVVRIVTTTSTTSSSTEPSQ